MILSLLPRLTLGMGVVTWREVRWIGSGNGSLQNRLQERRGRKISEVMVEVVVRSRTNTASLEFNRGNMIIYIYRQESHY